MRSNTAKPRPSQATASPSMRQDRVLSPDAASRIDGKRPVQSFPFRVVVGQKQLTAPGGKATAGGKASAGVNATAGVNLGGQRGGKHEDRGESTDDRKPDEHLSLSLGRRRTRQSAPCWLLRGRGRAELATLHGLSPKAKHRGV